MRSLALLPLLVQSATHWLFCTMKSWDKIRVASLLSNGDFLVISPKKELLQERVLAELKCPPRDG